MHVNTLVNNIHTRKYIPLLDTTSVLTLLVFPLSHMQPFALAHAFTPTYSLYITHNSEQS